MDTGRSAACARRIRTCSSPTAPAIDSASAAACPAIDQRGVVRPQGAACDVGAFELVG